MNGAAEKSAEIVEVERTEFSIARMEMFLHWSRDEVSAEERERFREMPVADYSEWKSRRMLVN
jgi:hypothetical protein